MSELARRVLWLAIEDYSGLWEVVWELNSLRPNCSAVENRASARELVSELLHLGLIEIFRCEEPDGEPVAVDKQVGERILSSEESWEPPEFHGVSWRIGATSQGEKAYRSFS